MAEIEFRLEAHDHYLRHFEDNKESLEYMMAEHLKMGGLYWGAGSLALLGRLDDVRKEEDIKWILSCKDAHCPGGFGANVGHDAEITSTHYALLVCCMYDSVESLDLDGMANFIAGLQREDGAFMNDHWGEVDIRFAYCAVSGLTIMNALDRIDTDACVGWILRCLNYDGGFGTLPRAETHGYAVWAAVLTLALLDALDAVDLDAVGWWLCERQTPSGGFNGRPEKAPDVCYSWWIQSALQTVDRSHWFDGDKLAHFILQAQDEDGGIADRPEDVPDVFHTFFGLCGLSLMGRAGLKPIHPVYALPMEVVQRMKLPPILASCDYPGAFD